MPGRDPIVAAQSLRSKAGSTEQSRTADSVHFQAHYLPAASTFVISCSNNQLLVSAGGS